MGLFDASKRRVQPATEQSNAAGAAASDTPKDAVKFDDFKAEVHASGLEADWSAKRLQKQFDAFDLNGDGKVSKEEFLICARLDPTILLAFGYAGETMTSGLRQLSITLFKDGWVHLRSCFAYVDWSIAAPCRWSSSI